MFTKDDLALMERLLGDVLEDRPGNAGNLTPSDRLTAFEMAIKIRKARLVGAQVPHKGLRDEARKLYVVEGFEDWEGIPVVHLAADGMHTRAPLGAVPALSELRKMIELHERLKRGTVR